MGSENGISESKHVIHKSVISYIKSGFKKYRDSAKYSIFKLLLIYG